MISLSQQSQALGPAVCVICGKSKGGSVTKDKHIREIFEMKKPGEWDMCKEHKKLFQEGFIALIEAVEPAHTLLDAIPVQVEARRTGKIVHVRYELAEQLFRTAIDRTLPMVFCAEGVTQRFESMMRNAAQVSDKKSS